MGVAPLHRTLVTHKQIQKKSIDQVIAYGDEYYNFMRQGRKQERGVTVLGPEYLIPFKMYAWLDLRRRKEATEYVNEKDFRKHKLDVFRLLQIIPQNVHIDTGKTIQADITEFLKGMEKENLNLEQIHIPMRKEEAIDQLRRIDL